MCIPGLINHTLWRQVEGAGLATWVKRAICWGGQGRPARHLRPWLRITTEAQGLLACTRLMPRTVASCRRLNAVWPRGGPSEGQCLPCYPQGPAAGGVPGGFGGSAAATLRFLTVALGARFANTPGLSFAPPGKTLCLQQGTGRCGSVCTSPGSQVDSGAALSRARRSH